jgi:uncharacterized membrane protein YhaH (DUF805 family)
LIETASGSMIAPEQGIGFKGGEMTAYSGAPMGGNRQVGFRDALALALANYATVVGRSSRGAFWWFVAFLMIGNVATAILDAIASSILGFGLFNALFSILTFVPTLTVAARRLHDIDRTGWWLLLGLIPLVGFVVLLFWFCRPGDRYPNRFGPDTEAGR